MHKLYNIIFLLTISFNYANTQSLAMNDSEKTTQFHINKIAKQLIASLASNSIESMAGIRVFVQNISNVDVKSQNYYKKFNFILSSAIKEEMQKRVEFNVFDFETLSSRNAKMLMKKYHIKYILKGGYSEFSDGIAMRIRILSLKDSKIISSANIYLKKILYKKIMNMRHRYADKYNKDDYFIKLKSSK